MILLVSPVLSHRYAAQDAGTLFQCVAKAYRRRFQLAQRDNLVQVLRINQWHSYAETSQGRAVVARQAHTLKAAGSNPAPAISRCGAYEYFDDGSES